MVSFFRLLVLTLLATANASDKTAVSGGCYTITDKEECCKHTDGRSGFGHDCLPSTDGNKFVTGHTCEPSCVVDGKCPPDNNYPDEPSTVVGTCAAPETEAPATITTTLTPWDSSASSSADSDSLESSYSSSFKDDSSDSTTDTSDESSGSAASGSSGSYMPLWMWSLAALCICCAVVAAAMAPKKKKKVPKKKPAPKGPAATTLSAAAPAGATTLEVVSQAGFKAGQVIEIDAGSPLAEIHDVAGLGSIILTAPLMYPHAVGAPVNELPDGAPLPELVATTTAMIPSYQMAAPVTTSYAAPQMYAAPATTAYAQPMSYAQPVAYSNAGYVV
jgi:hypothetical protein